MYCVFGPMVGVTCMFGSHLLLHLHAAFLLFVVSTNEEEHV